LKKVKIILYKEGAGKVRPWEKKRHHRQLLLNIFLMGKMERSFGGGGNKEGWGGSTNTNSEFSSLGVRLSGGESVGWKGGEPTRNNLPVKKRSIKGVSLLWKEKPKGGKGG